MTNDVTLWTAGAEEKQTVFWLDCTWNRLWTGTTTSLTRGSSWWEKDSRQLTSHAPWHVHYGSISSSAGANHPFRTPVEPTQHIFLTCQQVLLHTEKNDDIFLLSLWWIKFTYATRCHSLEDLTIVFCAASTETWERQMELTQRVQTPPTLLAFIIRVSLELCWKMKRHQMQTPSTELLNCSGSQRCSLSFNHFPQQQHLCINQPCQTGKGKKMLFNWEHRWQHLSGARLNTDELLVAHSLAQKLELSSRSDQDWHSVIWRRVSLPEWKRLSSSGASHWSTCSQVVPV